MTYPRQLFRCALIYPCEHFPPGITPSPVHFPHNHIRLVSHRLRKPFRLHPSRLRAATRENQIYRTCYWTQWYRERLRSPPPAREIVRVFSTACYKPRLESGCMNGVEDDLDGEDNEVVFPAMQDGDGLAWSPPNLPFSGGGFKWPRPSRKQERTVRESHLPVPTIRCRYPGCQASVRSDVAARLGGFCCDTHMW
jgi:hypothetical protein